VMVGARVSVWLNDKLVVDHAIMENYYDRKTPVPSKGPIQLQTHGGEIRWRNIFVREIPAEEANKLLQREDKGFVSVFNGRDLTGWQGAVDNYEVVDGAIRCKQGVGGSLFTKEEYKNFVARVEIRMPPGGNNGLAIRFPGQGDPAYAGMCELQVLDTGYPGQLDDRQYHGSAYGIVAAHKGYLRPAGQWNYQEVTVQGPRVKVELNGTVILDADLYEVKEYMANSAHPGLKTPQGYFGFAGHNDPVEFRNIQIKRLSD
jgi:3-keto-disaccharide hydrolase